MGWGRNEEPGVEIWQSGNDKKGETRTGARRQIQGYWMATKELELCESWEMKTTSWLVAALTRGSKARS